LASSANAVRPSADRQAGGVDPVKILLVEDSRTLRLSNERALLKAGYEVVAAEDGESALHAVKKHLPDLILLDLMLPRINGLEVLTRLKHCRGTAKIPVIVISGLSERNRQKLIDAGAEDYVEKSAIISEKGVNRLPEVLSELISRINRKRGGPFSVELVHNN
jgi:CheY-like chemotaxis protein